MPGFGVDPGSGVMVTGSYAVKAGQTQVLLQDAVGREILLGVEPRRRGAAATGWVQSGELHKGGCQAMVSGWQG